MIFDKLYESLKNTLLNAEEKFLEFLDKRAAGAAKLAAASKKKGGYALPTAIHFAAKARPYAECVKHKDDEEYIKKKAEECFKKLSKWDEMSQREFQAVMGELEVYGEVYIRKIKPNSLKLI